MITYNVQLNLYPNDEWKSIIDMKVKNAPNWYWKLRWRLTNGYVHRSRKYTVSDIYIIEAKKKAPFLLRLIAHEVGHVLGKMSNLDHKLYPCIMNPSWLFRW